MEELSYSDKAQKTAGDPCSKLETQLIKLYKYVDVITKEKDEQLPQCNSTKLTAYEIIMKKRGAHAMV